MPAFPVEKVGFVKYFIPSTSWWFVAKNAPTAPIYAEIDSDGSGIRIEWEINQSRTSNADQAIFRFYNVAQRTRDALYSAWKTNSGKETTLQIAFLIGWGGDNKLVFLGDIWKFNPSVSTGTDVIMEINAGDGDVTLRDSVTRLGQSFAQTTITLVVQSLVTTALGVIIEKGSLKLIQEAATNLPVQQWNTYVHYGDTQDRLDELIDTLGLEWKIFRGQFIVMQKGIQGVTDSPRAPVVSPATGLIAWAEQDDDNIQLTSLANPYVQPGRQIAVQDANGIFIGAVRHRVSTTRFYGTNYGESLMDIVARKAVLV